MLCLLLSRGSVGQTGNPFELGTEAGPPAAAEGAPTAPANPFDLTTDGPAAPVTAPAPAPPEALPDLPSDPRGFLFGLFVGLSLLGTLLVVLLRTDLRKAYRAFLNENLLSQYYREQAGVASGGLQLLYAFSLLSVGTYVFLLLADGRPPAAGAWGTWALTLGAVAGLVLLKQLAVFLTGRIFARPKPAGRYGFLLLVFGIVLGFALLPFSALLAFGPAGWTDGLVIASLLGVAGLLIFRYLRGLFLAAPLLRGARFHFFLYLCSIEIAPVLLLWKALN